MKAPLTALTPAEYYGRHWLHCRNCKWEGTYDQLQPLGSIGRLHCPKCSAEYGCIDGVPATDQEQPPRCPHCGQPMPHVAVEAVK